MSDEPGAVRPREGWGPFALLFRWAHRLLMDDHAAHALYAELLYHVRWDEDDPCCWPGRARLAEAIQRSTDTVDRCLAVLQERGLLWIEHRPGRASVYHVTHVDPGRTGAPQVSAPIRPPGRTGAPQVSAPIRPEVEVKALVVARRHASATRPPAPASATPARDAPAPAPPRDAPAPASVTPAPARPREEATEPPDSTGAVASWVERVGADGDLPPLPLEVEDLPPPSVGEAQVLAVWASAFRVEPGADSLTPRAQAQAAVWIRESVAYHGVTIEDVERVVRAAARNDYHTDTRHLDRRALWFILRSREAVLRLLGAAQAEDSLSDEEWDEIMDAPYAGPGG